MSVCKIFVGVAGCTPVSYFLWFLLCAKIDNVLSKFKCIFLILYIKNSSQYLRGLFYLFLDHNKSGLGGSNPNANPAHAQRSLSQNLCHALGIWLQVCTGEPETCQSGAGDEIGTLRLMSGPGSLMEWCWCPCRGSQTTTGGGLREEELCLSLL